MSDIDITEAIEVAARAIAYIGPDEDWPTNAALGGNLTGTRDDEYRREVTETAREALAAAAPLIAAQVRAQIAGAIEAEGVAEPNYIRRQGMWRAQAIARGDAK